jgi:hypothetical protein
MRFTLRNSWGVRDTAVDDGSVAVDIHVFDLELDRGVGRPKPMPADEAFLVPRPDVAVGPRIGALHHAVGGDEVDEGGSRLPARGGRRLTG